MRVIEQDLNKEDFEGLESGKFNFDVRIDSPVHEPGDMIVYHMVDSHGTRIKDKSIAFSISNKVNFSKYIERLGKQVMSKKVKDTGEIVIVTITPIIPRPGPITTPGI